MSCASSTMMKLQGRPGWRTTGRATAMIQASLISAKRGQVIEPITDGNVHCVESV